MSRLCAAVRNGASSIARIDSPIACGQSVWSEPHAIRLPKPASTLRLSASWNCARGNPQLLHATSTYRLGWVNIIAIISSTRGEASCMTRMRSFGCRRRTSSSWNGVVRLAR